MTGSDHPENPEDCRGTTSCTETVQITQRSRMCEVPTGPIFDRFTVNTNHPEPTAAVGGHSDSLSDPVADEKF